MSSDPRELMYQESMLCVGLENLGETFVDMNQVAKGLPSYQEAIDIREKLLAVRSDDSDRATALVETLLRFGDVQRQTADLAGAGRAYDRAIEILDPRAAHDPADPRLLDPLADVLNRRANLYEQSGQPDKSIGLLSRAAGLARAALKAAPDDSKARGRFDRIAARPGAAFSQSWPCGRGEPHGAGTD